MRLLSRNDLKVWAGKDLWNAKQAVCVFCWVEPASLCGEYELRQRGEQFRAHFLGTKEVIKEHFKGTLWRDISMSPKDWMEWARSVELSVDPVARVELAKQFPRNGSSHNEPSEEQPLGLRQWPWGHHETRLLRDLAAAAEKFWKLYDPAEPDTAPTNRVVTEWLVENGVSKRTAEYMATILRADGLSPGPRK